MLIKKRFESFMNSDTNLIEDLRDLNRSNTLDSSDLRWGEMVNLLEDMIDASDNGFDDDDIKSIKRKLQRSGHKSASDMVKNMTVLLQNKIKDMENCLHRIEGLRSSISHID